MEEDEEFAEGKSSNEKLVYGEQLWRNTMEPIGNLSFEQAEPPPEPTRSPSARKFGSCFQMSAPLLWAAERLPLRSPLRC